MIRTFTYCCDIAMTSSLFQDLESQVAHSKTRYSMFNKSHTTPTSHHCYTSSAFIERTEYNWIPSCSGRPICSASVPPDASSTVRENANGAVCIVVKQVDQSLVTARP